MDKNERDELLSTIGSLYVEVKRASSLIGHFQTELARKETELLRAQEELKKSKKEDS